MRRGSQSEKGKKNLLWILRKKADDLMRILPISHKSRNLCLLKVWLNSNYKHTNYCQISLFNFNTGTKVSYENNL